MAAGALAIVITLPVGSFAIFLLCFLFVFVATGIGNGATYRMIPAVFTARAGEGAVSVQRKAAAALGLIAAIGAYGGFLVPQLLSLSQQATGSYATAFIGFAGCYLVLMIITLAVYVRGRIEQAADR
jgi:NNP family nitrate/nitrite transporter-like MFS transporter